jgi:cytoskeleton protein RodZ
VFQPFTPVRLKERRRPNWSLVLVAGLIAVLGIAGFKYFGSRSPSAPSRPAAATQPDHQHKKSVKTAQVAQVTTPNHVKITLVATAGSITWAQLTPVGGTAARFQGDLGAPNGPQRKTWTFRRSVTVQLGNPGGAVLYLNGKKQVLVTNVPETLICTKTTCTKQ